MERALLGIDLLMKDKNLIPDGRRLGLLTNHASKNSENRFTRDVIHDIYGKKLRALFSPQHGFFGVEQDNMIESSHSYDERLGIPLFSLYSKVRTPSDYMYDEIDTLIIDLVDVGTRVYTFIYTMALCMWKATNMGKSVIVLDRPNPISSTVEGNLLKPEFTSFVGMYPIPMRHGMTIGELATLFNEEYGVGCELQIVKMPRYRRESYYDDSGLLFPFPSPNMPTLDSAIVYPGQVIFEATNISEGRGTTKPFEIFGAPFIEPVALKNALKKYDLNGVEFSEIYFKPTFNKYKGDVCGGLMMHVTDRAAFRPYITSICILAELLRLYPEETKFLSPPYEYEFKKLPFDIITGDSSIRNNLYLDDGIEKIKKIFEDGEAEFAEKAKKYYLY